MIFFKPLCILVLTIFLSIAFLFYHPVESKVSECTFYKWFDPNTNDKEGKLLLKNCSSCHMAYYNEWKNDKHSMSQNNPFFLSIYKSYRLDHPEQNGNCALCHNPEAALDARDAPMGRLYDVDLTKIKFKKTNGISCDFCHKVESVDQDPLKKGVAGLKVTRVCKGLNDIRFGPLKDPIQPGNKEELKYNSLFKTSLSCAKCHDGSNGNIQIYSTFTEWLNSPAAKKGVQCQSCHMAPRAYNVIARSKATKQSSDATHNEIASSGSSPPRNDVNNSIVDNLAVKHKARPYYEVHSHSFLTENPHEFRKKYVDLKVKTPQWGVSTSTLRITVEVLNNNFGHSFPTGSPMRNAILVVEAKDANGKNLKLTKGPKLSNYAGDLKDKPGKLFAKILSETSNEYAIKHSKAGVVFRKIANELGIPAQDWWNVFILSDTRIKANKSDISVYEFEGKDVIARSIATKQSPNASRKKIASPSARNDITITAKLIWRNTWPGLAKLKGFKLEEDTLIEKKLESQNLL